MFSVDCLPVDFHPPVFHLSVAVTYSAPQSLFLLHEEILQIP